MSEWMGRGTQSTPCVCGVSSAICVCVGGWVWGQERGERRQAWTAWEVGVVARRQAQRHTSVRATTVRRCAQSHHQHTHTADRAGQRTQWWWLVGMAHSGGGSHTTHSHHHHVPHTPCVCVMGVDSTSTASECTKWSHCPQHPRCHHQQQEQQEEEELVGGVGQKEWGWELVGGWGHTQARAWAHTSHQSVSGVVLSHGCVCGKRSALIHTTTSSRRRTRVDKDRKDKDWWDKKKEGVAPTPPHTTNKPESTMVVSQTTTPTQNHNNKKKKRKRKGEKGRWKQEEEREGQQAQGTVSVLVGCGTHVAQTTHHIHSTHTERDRKRKGTREKTEEDKGQGVVYGCGGDGKAGGKQVGDTPPLCPTFLPNPFFLPSPLFTPSLFPFFKTPNIMDYPNYFYKNTLLQTKLKLKEKTIQNERTQANLSASLFPDNSPTYNPLSHTPVVFWLSAYIFPEKSNYSFSHSYSIKPYKLSTNKQTQQPSCAITLHTFPSGCHLNT